jgi:hypothetical protein
MVGHFLLLKHETGYVRQLALLCSTLLVEHSSSQT